MEKTLALLVAALVGVGLLISGCGQKTAPVASSNTISSQVAPAEVIKTDAKNTVGGVIVEAAKITKEINKKLNVYSDKTAKDNHYTPSGWMGDYGDIKVDAGCTVNPHSGTTCIKVTYSAAQAQGAGWAGVYWQNPANNWGNQPGGLDLSGAKKLVFWARGGKGDEKIAEFKIGGIAGEYSDSDTANISDVKLTPEWKEYTIDLAGKDLSCISGGFCWVANAASNPNGFTIYLDDIYYE